MEKVRYMISDAANLVSVEAHVLRYWEEELELDIPRNEMGHRYYTKENIEQFLKIKELKEKGYQLKAIKMLVQANGGSEEMLKPEEKQLQMISTKLHNNEVVDTGRDGENNRMEQFQMIMTNIVRNAIAENNLALGKEVSNQVGERVLKEMNYLMREQDEQEEERYRKLDESIRCHQKVGRREKKVAKKEAKKMVKSARLFGQNKKLDPKQA